MTISNQRTSRHPDTLTPRHPHRRGDALFAYLAVLPALAVILALMLFPIAYSFYLSFNRTDGVTFAFIGLSNYADLVQDETFWRVLLNNFLFLIAVPLILLASLLCAVLMYEQVWGWKLFRVVFFVPSVISTVVIGLLFRNFFAFNGPVNQLLARFGAPAIDWMGSGQTAIAVIILALVWSSFGYGMLILLAGMASIDPHVYEAARLDGASWGQRVRDITLPLISKPMRFLSVINVIYTFTSLFGFIFVMTSGGPGYETTTVDYFIYLKAFTGMNLGAGAALAVLLFFIVMALTVVQFRFFGVDEGIA
jgi:ABC-type sugar transport system permease subunit